MDPLLSSEAGFVFFWKSLLVVVPPCCPPIRNDCEWNVEKVNVLRVHSETFQKGDGGLSLGFGNKIHELLIPHSEGGGGEFIFESKRKTKFLEKLKSKLRFPIETIRTALTVALTPNLVEPVK